MSSMPTAPSLGGVTASSRRAGWALSHGLAGCVARRLQICDDGHDAGLVEVCHHLGAVSRPVLGSWEPLLLAQCRFDAPCGVGSSFGDDAGFVCAARRFGQVGSFDGREFVVGATGDALQVGLEVVDKSTGFGGRRGECGGPQPARHPRSAIDRGAKGRDGQGLSCRGAQALAHGFSAEDRHRLRLPALHDFAWDARLRVSAFGLPTPAFAHTTRPSA